MKRKKGAKSNFTRIKENNLLITKDPNSPSVSIDGENNMGQPGECQDRFDMEVEQPTIVQNKIAKTSSIDSDVASVKPVMKTGCGRVKVKLKASKLLEPQKFSSDVQMPIASLPRNTDESNSQYIPEVNEMAAEKVDNTCSDNHNFEAGNMVLENKTRKPGSIKIKSSRGSDYSLKQMESKIPHKGSCYKTKELSAALGVIRKIMKMDAAGPFNAPVNPVALGIPDYFDIIDTPMDFGSICNDLEHGTKYKNSIDVYKDVQFIWDNCYKYNNKGDYILELMKRVKKNFMKYWTAAGLLTKTSVGTRVEDALWSHMDKSTSKIKSKQKRRRYGIDGHKSNCLCAVCVVRRRRKEREEHSAAFESHMTVSHTSSPNEPKPEAISVDNPSTDSTASSLDRSPETDADAEMDDAGKVETINLERTGSDLPERRETTDGEIEIYTDAANNETRGNVLHENGTPNQYSYDQECRHSNSSEHRDKKDDDEVEDESESQGEDEVDEVQQEEIQQEEPYPSEPEPEAKLFENPPQQENHSALRLFKDLFPGDPKSIWNGPHSLNRRRPATTYQNNPIRRALAAIFNP